MATKKTDTITLHPLLTNYLKDAVRTNKQEISGVIHINQDYVGDTFTVFTFGDNDSSWLPLDNIVFHTHPQYTIDYHKAIWGLPSITDIFSHFIHFSNFKKRYYDIVAAPEGLYFYTITKKFADKITALKIDLKQIRSLDQFIRTASFFKEISVVYKLIYIAYNFNQTKRQFQLSINKNRSKILTEKKKKQLVDLYTNKTNIDHIKIFEFLLVQYGLFIELLPWSLKKKNEIILFCNILKIKYKSSKEKWPNPRLIEKNRCIATNSLLQFIHSYMKHQDCSAAIKEFNT